VERVDVIVVGGGPGGLSAGLLLGRSRRRTVILDGNEPRNAQTHAAHSFLTRDGIAPQELRRISREQLATYPSIEVRHGHVTDARVSGSGFAVALSDGSELSARRLILATGVRDLLPDIEGIEERYGRSVFHCPYCDGWEQRDRPLAVLVEPAMAEAQAMMIQHWSQDLILLSHGEPLEADVVRRLEGTGIGVRTDRIIRLEGDGDRLARIHLASGEVLARVGMFVRPAIQPRTELAQRLGCELIDDGMIPGLIRVDTIQQTTVPGVYAIGDVATPMQQISGAVASGAVAGAMLNHALIAEDYARATSGEDVSAA
jgi:thioredoxin reductase